MKLLLLHKPAISLFFFAYVLQITAFRRSESLNIVQNTPLTGWPLRVNENVIKVSSKSFCTTSDCRTHEEAKNLVYCKMAKLSNLIDKKREILYAYTDFKAKGKGETSKFVFVVQKKSSSQNPDKIARASYLRVCVPVDASKDAWVDGKCVTDPCVEEVQKGCIQEVPGNLAKEAKHNDDEEKINERVSKKLEKLKK